MTDYQSQLLRRKSKNFEPLAFNPRCHDENVKVSWCCKIIINLDETKYVTYLKILLLDIISLFLNYLYDVSAFLVYCVRVCVQHEVFVSDSYHPFLSKVRNKKKSKNKLVAANFSTNGLWMLVIHWLSACLWPGKTCKLWDCSLAAGSS